MMYQILILFSLICLQCIEVHGQTAMMMSFNIKYDNPADGENSWDQRKESLVELIKRYHPDILGIQEGLLHQVEFIKQHVSDYQYIGVGRDDGLEKGEYSAIFYDSTKLELVSQKHFWLSETPDSVSLGWDAAMVRICTYGKFKIKATEDTLHVFNAHFDHVGSEARKRSAELISDKIIEFDLANERLIVMGDFNAIPDSEPIEILKRMLDYGLEISGSYFSGPTGTYNAFDRNREIGDPIDYIFTKHLEVVGYRHIGDRKENGNFISDHFPVFTEVKL